MSLFFITIELLAVCFEDMMELIGEDEMEKLESVVVARIGDLESLCDAFRGCHAIFHTSSFIDPHGVSGYTVRLLYFLCTIYIY